MSSTPAERATAPARWLLQAGLDGVPLTQTNVLARAVVREAVERWPGWWSSDIHGPPHREGEVRVLEALREGLLRVRLMRRRGRRLVTTPRGRELLAEPERLLLLLAADLGFDDPFTSDIAAEVIDTLRRKERVTWDEIVKAALKRGYAGWRDSTGRPPDENGLSWVINDIRCATEAYGLVEWHLATSGRRATSTVALTPAGRAVFGPVASPSGSMSDVLVFHAKLMNVPRVSAWVAARPEQHLTALHDAIQEAFGWEDDHLYSFWIDGRFWSGDEHEFTSPVEPEGGARTADLPIAELDLALDQTLAYVFDFGDDWRVLLTLKRIEESDGGSYPRVLKRTGEAPPQYPAFDEE